MPSCPRSTGSWRRCARTARSSRRPRGGLRRPGGLSGEPWRRRPASSWELEADARYLASLGVFLKDLDRGLVDFPARVGGEVVFLCWQEGEPEVAHYHPLSGGFKERRPLKEESPTPPQEARPGERRTGV